MKTISAGDQFEHTSIGRVEVKKLFVNNTSAHITEKRIIDNPESFVDTGETYVKMYCYVSGMPATEKLSEFYENVEPYEES